MGADIHTYIEVASDEGPTWTESVAQINLDRDYDLFGIMAGVRYPNEYTREPKGVPDDLGFQARWDYLLYISDKEVEGPAVTQEVAQGWVDMGISEFVDEYWVTNPDWHSHSWFSTAELAQIAAEYHSLTEYPHERLLATVAFMERLGPRARMVVWFDN